MSEPLNIHLDLGFLLVPKSQEIPQQIGYQTQWNEADYVPHESMS